MAHALIIAEVGVNHNGDRGLAEALMRRAVDAGADIVKFQTFKTGKLVTPTALKAPYQRGGTAGGSSQWEMLTELELSDADHMALHRLSQDLGVGFLSTPFDAESLRFLVHDLGLNKIKIGSGDVTNLPLVMNVGALECDLVLSTGMSTMEEIHEAICAYLFGLLYPARRPESLADLLNSVDLKASREVLRSKLVLLHCTSQYPTPLEDVNLLSMPALSAGTGLPVGFSDHSKGVEAALAAAALGAVMIEKHLTLDTEMQGPDHSASLDPVEFQTMVDGIRMVEKALGDSVKKPRTGELGNREVARRGLYVSRDVVKGQSLQAVDIDILRPIGASAPREYWNWIGAEAPESFSAGQALPSILADESDEIELRRSLEDS